MIASPTKERDLITTPKESAPNRPKETRITLRVCSCYRGINFYLLIDRGQKIASLLGTSLRQLHLYATTAANTGQPQVVACYQQRDVAEIRLQQVKALGPFIDGPCHWFDISEA